MSKIILASESRSRRALLVRLNLDFEVQISGVDETPRKGETIASLVERLALEKARAVGATQSDALIIGSDQAACINNKILGKPADLKAAQRQLALCSGNTTIFHTSVCLLDTMNNRHWVKDVITTVYFRNLSEQEIKRYVETEEPLDCAGSFRSESLGISLFERIESDDPTALLGLPLITLCMMLRQADWKLP